MLNLLPDEYQGVSAGSLVEAKHCWRDLSDADLLPVPQRFVFVFRSPTEHMASGLVRFLRYARYAGYVRLSVRVGIARGDPWHVIGTTQATVCALRKLERLFMSLRRAGARYESTLVTLDRLPMSDNS